MAHIAIFTLTSELHDEQTVNAVTRDFLVNVEAEDVRAYESGLFTFLDTDSEGAAVMQTIRETGKLEEDTENGLKAVLGRYTELFISSKPAK